MYYKKDNFFKSLTPGKRYRRARWDILRYVTNFVDGSKKVYVFKEWSKKRQAYYYQCITFSHLELEIICGLWTTYYHKRKEYEKAIIQGFVFERQTP